MQVINVNNIREYLDHIQAEEKDELNLSFLSHLQKQHVLTVPFENLDILKKKPLSLQTKALYQKIVQNRRGGVCYELNGSFYHLLKELGFNPSLMAGTAYAGNGAWALENGHLFMIVPLENKDYLVDVGFEWSMPTITCSIKWRSLVISSSESDSDGTLYR